jgi:MFS family permease
MTTANPSDLAGAPLGSPQRGSLSYLVLVCFVATLGGLLFGYDTGVISAAIEFLELRFDLSPAAKGWAAASALAGCVVGCAVAGWMNDLLGRKKVLLLCAVLFIVSALGTAMPVELANLFTLGFYAESGGPPVTVVLTTFTIFRLVGGIGVGAASMTSPMYIAEISPARIRGRMVSLNQLAIVTGFLVVYFANYYIGGYGQALDQQVVAATIAQRGDAIDPERTRTFLLVCGERSTKIDKTNPLAVPMYEGAVRDFVESQQPLEAAEIVTFLKIYEVNVDDTEVYLANFDLVPWNVERGWRWMFGSETVPAVLLLALLFFVPESPRWLTKQSRRDEALAVLSRVNGREAAEREVREIEEAIALETGSLAQLFEPGVRMVLVIGVVLAVLQQVTGINVFLYFGPEIFKGISGAGMDAALLQTVIVGAVNLVFTVVAIWTVDLVGRKPLMLIGFTGMGVSLLALGLSAFSGATGIWMLVFILTYIASFALAVGPVTWVILSEIFPTRVRGRALAIATVCLWAANFVVSQTFPMMDKNDWLIATFNHAFPFWVYGVMCVVAVVFLALYVPETKQRSLEEIEKHWLGKKALPGLDSE